MANRDSLLGWTGGLVIEVPSQIEVAGEKVARSSYRTQPRRRDFGVPAG